MPQTRAMANTKRQNVNIMAVNKLYFLEYWAQKSRRISLSTCSSDVVDIRDGRSKDTCTSSTSLGRYSYTLRMLRSISYTNAAIESPETTCMLFAASICPGYSTCTVQYIGFQVRFRAACVHQPASGTGRPLLVVLLSKPRIPRRTRGPQK